MTNTSDEVRNPQSTPQPAAISGDSSTVTEDPPLQMNGKTGDASIPPPMPSVNTIDTRAPLRWLSRASTDLVSLRFKGCFYGLMFVLMGYAIVYVYATRWQLTMGLIGGFFLMGPFLCSGLYDLSRQREETGSASLVSSLTCWTRNIAGIGFFAVMLTFTMIVWARVSLILFALSSTTSFPTVQGVLKMIFSLQNPQFLMLWAGIGFIFASLVFAIGVIAVPMMLDRKCDVFTAVFSSFRCVLNNPKPLYLWAVLVVLIIGVSLVAGFIPLIITAPLIGHATWHAYRDLIAPQAPGEAAVSQ